MIQKNKLFTLNIHMSLAQLLQSYSQDISAREEHNNAVGDRNADAKANTMQEDFQHHLDALNAGAVDLGTASSAYHMGRKIYQKVKQGNKVAKQIEDLKNTIKNSGKDKPSGEEGGAEESQAGQEPADGNVGSERGGADVASDIQPRAGAEPNASDLDARVDAVQSRFQQLKARVSQPFEPEARVPVPASEASNTANIGVPKRDMPDKAFGKQAERFQNRSNQLTAQKASADAEPATADAPQSQTVANNVQADPTPQQTAQPTPQVEDAGPQAPREFLNREGTPLRPSQGEVAPRNTAPNTGENTVRAEPDTAPRGNLGGDGPSAVGTEIESGINDADRGAGALSRAGAAVADTINGVKTSVGNMARNVASKVGGAVKSVLPESMGDLGTEAAVSLGLDAIPVVGEVASVITGLVSLFEGIHHDDAKPKALAPQKTPVQVASGIDPTALTSSAPAQATIV